nr:immunoglobulin light chain junction region [Macaca mulatta]
YMQALETPYTF